MIFECKVKRSELLFLDHHFALLEELLLLLLLLLPGHNSLPNPAYQFFLLLALLEQVAVGAHLPVDIILLLHLCQLHPVLPEPVLPPLLDVGDAVHGLDGPHVEVPVVLDGFVLLVLELVDGVVADLLVVEFAMGLGPGQLSGVVLGLEVAVALGPAESECFAIVPHEHHPVPRIYRARAEVAPLDSHQQLL